MGCPSHYGSVPVTMVASQSLLGCPSQNEGVSLSMRVSLSMGAPVIIGVVPATILGVPVTIGVSQSL